MRDSWNIPFSVVFDSIDVSALKFCGSDRGAFISDMVPVLPVSDSAEYAAIAIQNANSTVMNLLQMA